MCFNMCSLSQDFLVRVRDKHGQVNIRYKYFQGEQKMSVSGHLTFLCFRMQNSATKEFLFRHAKFCNKGIFVFLHAKFCNKGIFVFWHAKFCNRIIFVLYKVGFVQF